MCACVRVRIAAQGTQLTRSIAGDLILTLMKMVMMIMAHLKQHVLHAKCAKCFTSSNPINYPNSLIRGHACCTHFTEERTVAWRSHVASLSP